MQLQRSLRSPTVVNHLLLALHLARLASSTCYFPDGTIERNHTPCNTSTSISACCRTDSLCINDGLCLDGANAYRGSCTDKGWSSDCPAYCRNEVPQTGVTIVSCDARAKTYACNVADLGKRGCESGNTFTLKNDVPTVYLRADQALELGYETGFEIQADTKLTSNLTQEEQHASNGSVTTTASQQNPPDDSDKNFTAMQMIGVGVGVGVPLLLALIAALVYISKLRKRHEYAPAATASSGKSEDFFLEPKTAYPGYKQPQLHEMDPDPFPTRRELE
ncbi:unnamed protein product [Zymoseptoria tritici ST99CH_1A5]|uniref:Mid2 domain-containing protein n=2 Tax=Zymoseptoria tritici TaxID=1047171 RepID=A0A2H1FP52_ZYMTR|nr:unnamed protein product [Zymoseptoria tritici ST99CH_1E4]SMY20431.1 unnamed protein product [Zymoseptoria tritici ST99CH_1A5]